MLFLLLFFFGLAPELDAEANEKTTLVQKERLIISERRGMIHHIEPSHL